MRLREACGIALLAASVLGLTSCLLPVRSAPGVSGIVVDQATGEPVEGAHVVVRFDGSYGDKLPDREHLGHAEAVTGPDGRFSVGRYTRAGITWWPGFETEARVAAVLRTGYRCAKPVQVREGKEVRVMLAPALDLDDQRQSCRPVASRRGEAEGYRMAWRGLFPAPETPAEREQKHQLARLLEARAVLGFGANCEGPVTDLALAPGGRRAAFIASGARGPEVQLVEIGPRGPGELAVAATASEAPPRRLAWTGPGELVLWRPADDAERAISPSVFAPGAAEVVWRNVRPLPAAIDRKAAGTNTLKRRPLDPADLSDESENLWLGRSFALERQLDPDSGLSRDQLDVSREDGTRYTIDLPGEACGGPRYGRPQYRIGAEGRMGLDLRFVDGGCHAVAIDLETGDWARLDRSQAPAVCRAQRSIPPSHLTTALRGWSRELTATLERAGADTGATYALRIGPDGVTQVRARDMAGQPLVIEAPRFPIATPLQRIDVTHVAPHTGGSRGFPGSGRVPEPTDPEPL